jgi:hypothetical protein
MGAILSGPFKPEKDLVDLKGKVRLNDTGLGIVH